MNGITQIDRTGRTLPCVPATVVSHAIAYAQLPVSFAHTAATTLRAWGDVSRERGMATGVVVAGPIFDDKCTGVSVPGRRGGT
ncbi:hypothetical protein WIS52_13405 [Pseudonocardia nematodicida]|uniref:Uncharacterized protein n=1 Tax=Pseudonocardia nematodicida TaxID=1206997 RepID=A0ABV1KC46_9PSEU